MGRADAETIETMDQAIGRKRTKYRRAGSGYLNSEKMPITTQQFRNALTAFAGTDFNDTAVERGVERWRERSAVR